MIKRLLRVSMISVSKKKGKKIEQYGVPFRGLRC
jgi:hypothetical protein